MTAPVEEAPPLVVPRPASQRVQPGVVGSIQVAITNTGSVVDEFALDLLGDPGPWGTVEPATVSLFPGQEGLVTVGILAPKGSAALAGPHVLGIRARSTRNAAASSVEEVTIDVGPAPELAIRLVPSSRSGSGGARFRVDLENLGNVPLEVGLTGHDPDELLKVTLQPDALTVDPGRRVSVKAKVSAVEPFFRGPTVQRSFVVEAAAGQAGATATGRLNQGALLGGLAVPAATGLVALALLAFALNNKLITLPGAAGPTQAPQATQVQPTVAPPSSTPAPPSADPTSASATEPPVFAQGTLKLAPYYATDFDDVAGLAVLAEQPSTDTPLDLQATDVLAFRPVAGAKIQLAGSSPQGLAGCRTISKRGIEIAHEALAKGHHLCLLSNAGRITELELLGVDGELEFRYTTWDGK